jgi:hypothetical protein
MNVKTALLKDQLEQLSNTECENIQEGEFVYGWEDADGFERYEDIDITKLASDALELIKSLQNCINQNIDVSKRVY